MIGYVGKAPLTLVRRLTGRTDYVYFGQPAPADAIEGEFDRLVSEGYLEPVEVVEVEVEPATTAVVVTDPPLDEMNADQLRAFAEERGIDTGRASTAEGLLAKIREAGQA